MTVFLYSYMLHNNISNLFRRQKSQVRVTAVLHARITLLFVFYRTIIYSNNTFYKIRSYV